VNVDGLGNDVAVTNTSRNQWQDSTKGEEGWGTEPPTAVAVNRKRITTGTGVKEEEESTKGHRCGTDGLGTWKKGGLSNL